MTVVARAKVTFVFDTDGMLSNGGGIVDQPVRWLSNKYPTVLNLHSNTDFAEVVLEYLVKIDEDGWYQYLPLEP